MRPLTEIERDGWNDGYEMGRESGSTQAPPSGWDGLLIEQAGFSAAFEVLGTEEHDGDWTEEELLGLLTYAKGAQAGCEQAVVDRNTAE